MNIFKVTFTSLSIIAILIIAIKLDFSCNLRNGCFEMSISEPKFISVNITTSKLTFYKE